MTGTELDVEMLERALDAHLYEVEQIQRFALSEGRGPRYDVAEAIGVTVNALRAALARPAAGGED